MTTERFANDYHYNMTTPRLFIIGNGFDIHHKLKTRYISFREWLVKQIGVDLDDLECELSEFIMENQGEDIPLDLDAVIRFLAYVLSNNPILNQDNWSNFEESLGEVDLESVFRQYSHLIKLASTDESGNINYSWEADVANDYANTIRKNMSMLGKVFDAWISGVKICRLSYKSDVAKLLKKGDLFLSFNYTETLEKVYGIRGERICHIHGLRQRDELVIGHGGTNTTREFGIPGVGEHINEAIQALKKDTDSCIKKNEGFFNQINELRVKDVVSFGFSYGKNDLPYIGCICKHMDNNDSSVWYLNNHDLSKIEEWQSRIYHCGFRGIVKPFSNYRDIHGKHRVKESQMRRHIWKT